MSLEQRLEKPLVSSFGFFSRKTTVSMGPGHRPVAGPLKSAKPSGKMEGLRRPWRFQLLCLLDPSPCPTVCPLLPSGRIPVSRLWGQLDAFSSWGWLGLSGCLAAPTADLLWPSLPSWGSDLLNSPLAWTSGSSESPGSSLMVGLWSSRVQGLVGEEGFRRFVMLLKAMPGDTSLLLLLVEAKDSVDLPVAGGQEVRPVEEGVETVQS